jgi:hypothetical protein
MAEASLIDDLIYNSLTAITHERFHEGGWSDLSYFATKSGKAFLSRNPQWMVEKAQWRHVPSAAEQ